MMNYEELKMVVDLLKGISGDAAAVALWWIAASNVVYFLIWVGGFAVAAYAAHRFTETSRRIKEIEAGKDKWSEVGRGLVRAWAPKHTSISHYEFGINEFAAYQRAMEAGKDANREADRDLEARAAARRGLRRGS